MKATATSDVDVALLSQFQSEIAPDLDLHIDERAIFLRSVEPPSWIQFFAEAQWWVKALGAYAALYVAELVKEAGKDTWKERAKLVRGTVHTGSKVLKLARALLNLRSKLPERSRLVLGLPVPDDYFGVRFELLGRNEELLAAEIALFVRHLPALERLIEAEGLKSGKVTGAISLLVGEDASLHISWMDSKALSVQERVLRILDEA